MSWSVWVRKEFPDTRQNERRIKFISKAPLGCFFGGCFVFVFCLFFCPWETTVSSDLWGWGNRKEQSEVGGVGRPPPGELVPSCEAFGFDASSEATSLPGGNHRSSAAVIAV